MRFAAQRARGGGGWRDVRWPLVAAVPVAVVIVRRRRATSLPPLLATGLAAAVPPAVALSAPRSRARHVATWVAHMWAYKVAYAAPYDRPDRLRQRLRIDGPLRCDVALGAGRPPGLRLQRSLRRPPALTPLDWAASVVYWAWDAEPHLVLAWLLVRHPARFPAAAARLAATFDLTVPAYWLVPSAPPWWASEREGRMDGEVRRVTIEAARALCGRPRPAPREHALGQNPWAAMPSDHFATAVQTALTLSALGRGPGFAGWAYASLLGAALVYTGEHYAADLLAGLALALAVRTAAPRLAPVARAVERCLAPLEP
jgi:hypothetical protein